MRLELALRLATIATTASGLLTYLWLERPAHELITELLLNDSDDVTILVMRG